MKHFTPVQLNHANLKRPIHVIAGTIAGYHFSDKTQCTHLYTTGGIFPVAESPEQIDQILTALEVQGDKNVHTTATV